MMKNIVYNDVSFTIEGDKLREINHKGKAIDVFIPHKFPSGDVINTIANGYCFGKYNRIVIDDDISEIEGFSFSNSFITEVVWPASCDFIPEGCFAESTIKKVSNIEHVTSIGDSAFYWSYLDSFSWPHNCAAIPKRCFAKSTLKTITGLNVVQEIRELAFLNVFPSESIDLSGCASLVLCKNAFLGADKSMFISPYYINRADWEHAFNEQALKRMMPR